jgi:hypothetical protein
MMAVQVALMTAEIIGAIGTVMIQVAIKFLQTVLLQLPAMMQSKIAEIMVNCTAMAPALALL